MQVLKRHLRRSQARFAHNEFRDSGMTYRERAPTPKERAWFAKNRNVWAYASPDMAVVFNPHVSMSKRVRRSLYVNECVRLFLRQQGITPRIVVTAGQLRRFRGTVYERNIPALKQTLVARLVAKDPSAGRTTQWQRGYAECLSQVLVAMRRGVR